MEITKWMEKVITCLKRGKPLAGRGIIVEETPLGSRIHAKAVIEGAAAQGSPAYYCKTTGQTGLYYNVDIYDKIEGKKISNGYALPMNLLFSENIPMGTPVVAFKTTTNTLG